MMQTPVRQFVQHSEPPMPQIDPPCTGCVWGEQRPGKQTPEADVIRQRSRSVVYASGERLNSPQAIRTFGRLVGDVFESLSEIHHMTRRGRQIRSAAWAERPIARRKDLNTDCSRAHSLKHTQTRRIFRWILWGIVTILDFHGRFVLTSLTLPALPPSGPLRCSTELAQGSFLADALLLSSVMKHPSRTNVLRLSPWLLRG
jgi:hypothetical protein